MSKRIDLTGKYFDNLEVLEYIGCVNTHAIYNCKCLKCGSITKVSASNLKSGNSKGCQKCKSYKFDLETSQIIHDRWKLDGATQKELAKEYNCSRGTIINAIKRIAYIEENEDV